MTGNGEVPTENREPAAAADADAPVTEPTDLKFVGPATAGVVDEAAFEAADIRAKRVSYDMLVDAGVNPGVAAKLRRWHSLSWSFASGSGLGRRSEQVRGLQADERAWVAASAGYWTDTDDTDEEDTGGTTEEWAPGDGPTTPSTDATTTDDWTPGDWGDAGAADPTTGSDATADGSGDAAAAESAWREHSVPTPVTAVDGLDSDDAEQLAEAGVTSVRSLATCTPELVADILDFAQSRVETWHERARDRVD